MPHQGAGGLVFESRSHPKIIPKMILKWHAVMLDARGLTTDAHGVSPMPDAR